MKKLIATFTIVLGTMVGLTSLPANAANNKIIYGMWHFYQVTTSRVNFDTVRTCTYARSRYQQGFGPIQDQLYSVTVVNKGCPSEAGNFLPK